MLRTVSEEEAVLLSRTREAYDAGLSMEEARAFAHSGRDIGELRHLVAEQCPVELLRRIVL